MRGGSGLVVTEALRTARPHGIARRRRHAPGPPRNGCVGGRGSAARIYDEYEYMAANIFLKFEPEIKGESKQKGYENQLEILSMSWGCTQAGGFAYSDGGGVS